VSRSDASLYGLYELARGVSGRGWHRALGKLDPGPDIHVDDDGDDLEDLLRAEVLGERVVEALERRVPVGVGGTGERLGVAECRLLGLGVKLGLPPRRQGVDLRPGDARLARRSVSTSTCSTVRARPSRSARRRRTSTVFVV
jgi:hypothetical protein